MRAGIWPAAAVLIAAALAGACSLLHDEYPDRSCEGNSDCFRAQGEFCERDAGICKVAEDAGPASSEEPEPPEPAQAEPPAAEVAR